MFIRRAELETRIKDVEQVKELLENLRSEILDDMDDTGCTEFAPDENYSSRIRDAAQEMNSLVGYFLQVS